MDSEAIWDERAWVWMCRGHHHRLDNKFIHLTRDQLPEGIEDYAAEHGLWWSLDKDFGELAT